MLAAEQVGSVSFESKNSNKLSYFTGNNFAKGYYTEGAALLEDALDPIRREVEMSGCFQVSSTQLYSVWIQNSLEFDFKSRDSK